MAKSKTKVRTSELTRPSMGLNSISWLLGIITCAIWPSATDGFSLIKSLVFLPAVLMLAVFHWRAVITGLRSKAGYLVGGFILWNFILIALSDYKSSALFGVSGRSMGSLIYIALAIFMLVISQIGSEKGIHLGLRSFTIVAGLIALYGLLQSLNADPIHWALDYKGIIETFGNPNFAGTFTGLSITAFLLSGYLEASFWKRFGYLVFGVIGMVNLYKTHALQGVVVCGVSLAVVIIGVAFERNRKAGFFALGIVGFAGINFILGLFKLGPLGNLVYKSSVGYRADFFRTALTMMRKHPFFGVGMDRFGVNYRIYRDNGQVLRIGVDNFSDNAHNIYLHFAAIGGIPLAILLLFLNIYIFHRAFRLVTNPATRNIHIYAISGLWLAIQLDLLVSPDSLGLSIWGWFFAGLILFQDKSPQGVPHQKRPAILFAFLIPILIVVVIFESFQLRASVQENYYFYAQIDSSNAQLVKVKEADLLRAEKLEPWNAEWPILTANSLIQDKDYVGTIAAARRALSIDAKDYRAWWFLATAQESLGNRVEAIPAREKSISLDPLNTSDMVELARDYKAQGNKGGAVSILQRIHKLNPDGKDYFLATKDLAGL